MLKCNVAVHQGHFPAEQPPKSLCFKQIGRQRGRLFVCLSAQAGSHPWRHMITGGLWGIGLPNVRYLQDPTGVTQLVKKRARHAAWGLRGARVRRWP